MPGGHAARSAARAFRAVQEGRPSHSRGRPAKSQDAPRSRRSSRCKGGVPPRKGACVEIYANSNSKLARTAAQTGHRAIRVALHTTVRRSCGTARQRGRVLTWATDLLQERERQRCLQSLLELRRELRATTPRPPLLVHTSPDCSAFSCLATTNRRWMTPRKVAEKTKRARLHLEFCRRIHALFSNEPCTVCTHEQPQRARIPEVRQGERVRSRATWPWAIAPPKDYKGPRGGRRVLRNYSRTVVHGCAAGLRDPDGAFLFKPWIFETSGSDVLAKALAALRCPGDHEHGVVQGRWSKRSAAYPPMLVAILLAVLGTQ